MEVDIKKMIAAAQAGGAVLKKYFGQSLDVVQKSVIYDLKSRADDESEAAIVEILKKEFPGANVQAEETGKFDNGSEYTFVIDPLDGTHNFLLGIPTFTVSIGLIYQRSIIAGVIYVPTIDQTFYAERGKGAYLEGKRIQVSQETDFTRSIISTSFYYGYDHDRVSRLYANVLNKKPIRLITDWCSTYKLCLVASGKFEGMTVDNGEIHDYVAGKLIAREAGCLILDYEGNPETDELATQFIAVNNAVIAEQLLNILKVS